MNGVLGTRPAFVLFPGRHHLLTYFQAEYLRRLASPDEPGSVTTIVWAVTSANHANTKRNPVPYHRREAAIERLSVLTGLRSVVVPVYDTPPTDRFAEVTLKSVLAETGLKLTPADTIVACSTPEVTALYQRLGFSLAGVEADPASLLPDGRRPERPWDVLLRLAAGDETWRELAHPATVDVFDRYHLINSVPTIINDPIVGDEGGLTTTRDYRTYLEAFANSAARKWKLVRRHVKPGRIVDIGCGAGAVLELADRDPALHESDLIGVEVARHLFDECMHKKAQGVFRNPNIFFYRRNVLGGAVFPPRSIDTTLTFALTHEIWSFGDCWASLRGFIEAVYDQTVPGGVWINSDVCGPAGLDRSVVLQLTRTDGRNPLAPRTDLAELPHDVVTEYVASLSTRARLDQFAVDYAFPFKHAVLDAERVELSFADAMDYLTRKDYTDNWLSETREQFCGLEFADWVRLLTEVGFDIGAASTAWRNDWIIENRIAPVASVYGMSGAPLDWPVTHILTVARRPLNS